MKRDKDSHRINRQVKSIIFWIFCSSMLMISVVLFIFILGMLIKRGLPYISLKFVSERSVNFGQEGGVAFQIAGTIILVSGAGLLALPLSISASIYQARYLSSSLKFLSSIFIYALNGVPTIIFGLFGYMLFGLYLHLGVSWLTGVLILSIMILPTLVVSMKEAINDIPLQFIETASSLGLSEWSMTRNVILPYARHGIVTGLLLGIGRAAGETAAIMFTATAFSGVTLPSSLSEPVVTLQTHILILSQEATNALARGHAWGAALLLVGIVSAVNAGALIIRLRYKRGRADDSSL